MSGVKLLASKFAAGVRDGTDVRCCCGSLLARLVGEGVEIKCRRCKHTQVLPLDSLHGHYSPAAQ